MILTTCCKVAECFKGKEVLFTFEYLKGAHKKMGPNFLVGPVAIGTKVMVLN